MAFIPVPNGVKIAMEFDLNNQVVVNVYYLTYPSPIVTANLTALATIFRDWWNTNARQNFSTSIGLFQVTATDVRVANGLQTALLVSPFIFGTLVGASVPNNVAAVTTMRTGFSGRSFRGRKYFASILASEVSDNFIGATRVGDILLDMASLRTAVIAGGADLVVSSFRTNNAPRVTAVTTPATTFTMDLRVDSQRRRLPDEGT